MVYAVLRCTFSTSISSGIYVIYVIMRSWYMVSSTSGHSKSRRNIRLCCLLKSSKVEMQSAILMDYLMLQHVTDTSQSKQNLSRSLRFIHVFSRCLLQSRASRVYGRTCQMMLPKVQTCTLMIRVLWWYKVNLQGEEVYTTLLSMVCEVLYTCKKNHCWNTCMFPKQSFTRNNFVSTHSIHQHLTVSSWFL